MYKAMLLWFLHNGALPAAHHCQVTQIPTFAILKVLLAGFWQKKTPKRVLVGAPMKQG